MEITSQIANLEDEIKLLKGEIKSVLKEIRAAVLSQDNPFGMNAISLTPPAASPAPAQPVPPPVLEATPQSSPPISFPSPTRPEVAAERPQIFHEEPAPRRQAPEAARPREDAPDPADDDKRPSLLTIASLLGWVEDTLISLGPRRFRLTLELAYFAELLSPEVRDVLRDLPQLWPDATEPERPLSVNECLLVLRQLEAILQGEQVTRLPRRRARRRAQFVQAR